VTSFVQQHGLLCLLSTATAEKLGKQYKMTLQVAHKIKSLLNQKFTDYPPFILPWIALVLVIVYATWNTGLAADDYVLLNRGLSVSIWDDLLPHIFIADPFQHYELAIFFHVIGDVFWGYSLLKAIYICFALFAVFRFFSKFTSPGRAFLGMVVFILSPIHDGGTFWLVGQYLMISMGCYLLAYVFAVEGNKKLAFLLAIIASFSCYGSSPIAIFLGGIFLWRREFKNACIILIPNMIYTVYYIYVTMFLKLGPERIPTAWDWTVFAKKYVMQVLSYGDAALGPSAILKIFLAINSMELFSILIVCCFAITLWLSWKPDDSDYRPDNTVLIFALLMVLVAFGLFAVTGRYPQIAFNLGNRVTIFGNFFLALIAMKYLSKRFLACTAIVICATFLGLGNHWSRWNDTVLTSISNIRGNEKLASLVQDETVFVSGLQYSTLGSMAHIDYFSTNYILRTVFIYAMQTPAIPRPISLNRNMELVDSELWDRKFGGHYAVSKPINVYNAVSDRFSQVKPSDIHTLLYHLPVENRHWVQLLEPGWIRDTIVWLMPSVRYAFRSTNDLGKQEGQKQ